MLQHYLGNDNIKRTFLKWLGETVSRDLEPFKFIEVGDFQIKNEFTKSAITI